MNNKPSTLCTWYVGTIEPCRYQAAFQDFFQFNSCQALMMGVSVSFVLCVVFAKKNYTEDNEGEYDASCCTSD